MFQTKNENPPNVMEYYDWIVAQGFKTQEEHHRYVSRQEQDFMQNVVYPMFYKEKAHFKTPIPFPMVLKDYSSERLKYVINNAFFTIIFFSYDNLDGEVCWEVSVHVKNHDFCDERILSFKKWFMQYYCNDERVYSIQMEEMPKEFLFPRLDFYDDKVQDFCIEFWNSGRDFMLFKLLDLLRLF